MWHLEIDNRRVKDLWPVRFAETEQCNTNNSLSLASQALMIRIANEARITHRGWKASGLNASTPWSSLKAELELPKSPSKRQGFAKDSFDFQLVRHDIRTVCVHRPRTCVIVFCPWIAASALPTWSSSLNKWTASNLPTAPDPSGQWLSLQPWNVYGHANQRNDPNLLSKCWLPSLCRIGLPVLVERNHKSHVRDCPWRAEIVSWQWKPIQFTRTQ